VYKQRLNKSKETFLKARNIPQTPETQNKKCWKLGTFRLSEDLLA